jgi:hypothetical protein
MDAAAAAGEQHVDLFNAIDELTTLFNMKYDSEGKLLPAKQQDPRELIQLTLQRLVEAGVG